MAKFRFNEGSRRRILARFKAATEKKKQQLALALGMWADDTVGDIREQLLSMGIIDQGMLIAATTRTPVTITALKIRVTVFNNEEYATVIEFGRRPLSGFPPPLLPLVGWAGRKGIISALPRNISFDGEWKKKWAASGAIFRNIKRGRKAGKSGSRKPLDPEIRDLLIVRFIADKIHKKGFPGRHPFSIVFERRIRTFRKDIASMVRFMK